MDASHSPATALTTPPHPDDFEVRFRIFHELMRRKVGEILLVSTPYDAFIMEEDGSLASRIIHEYRGLNMSRPPRISKTFSGAGALALVATTAFDMVVAMPGLADMDTAELVLRIKADQPGLPVVLLAHRDRDLAALDPGQCAAVDNQFIWTGNADLLLALVKNVEDRLNVDDDTRRAGVRVLLLVEDSPLYRSLFLPLIYRVVVTHTRRLMEDTLNEEHRLLKMRARPKILVAENYEMALTLFERFKPYISGVIADTRFPMECQLTDDAGSRLLAAFRRENPFLPVLLTSSQSENQARADAIGAVFVDKNSERLEENIEAFFRDHLGFGELVFRLPDGAEIGRASNLRSLERVLREAPDESIRHHAERNHFSNWLMARTEIALASRFADVSASEFASDHDLREYIVNHIHLLRKYRQQGVVTRFSAHDFDPDITEFMKIGNGSLGGKARGLAFLAHLLRHPPSPLHSWPGLDITVPQTLVITTDWFEEFVESNGLLPSRIRDCDDAEVEARFLAGRLPGRLKRELAIFLRATNGPLAVRSSSLLEDAHWHPFSGLYRTVLIPNVHADFQTRLTALTTAIKRVYASTWFRRPLDFARRISQQFQEDRMAVMIQSLAGRAWGRFFYPDVSGTACSWNFYPIGRMAHGDGVARLGLGLGQSLEDGDRILRFCPRYPEILPQFSTVDDILAHAQRRSMPWIWAPTAARPAT